MIRTLALALLVMTVAAMQPASAQDEQQQVILKETVTASFGKVWDAIKTSMAELGCGKAQTEKIIEPAEETGFYKGVYVSDFCMLATGEDTTKKFMEQFGRMPKIRGAIWITGRVQYKINVKEDGVKQTTITLRSELSGFEEFITNQVYFWTSNGILEKKMMDAILAKVNTDGGSTVITPEGE